MRPLTSILVLFVLTVALSGLPLVMAEAHELIPQALVTYIENNPSASATDIETFLKANPEVQAKSTASSEALLNAARAEDNLTHTMLDFMKLGVTHVLSGLDHVLFVLVIILSTISVRTMLRSVTSFTVAHSITLILAAVGFLTIPSQLVEPIIALSIVYLALTTLVFKNLPFNKHANHGVAVIFIFGLFHGLGFAGIIQDVGIASGRLLPALLSFNIGVEIAQLLIVAAVFPFVYLAKSQDWYLRSLQFIGAGIALIAMIWTFERIFGITVLFTLQ